MHKPMLKAALLVAFTVVIVVLASSQQATAQNPKPGSAPVNIVGPLPLPVTGSLEVGGTVNVHDVDKTVRTPFQKFLRSDIDSGRSFTVDPSKSLTIEFVTSNCVIQLAAPQTNSGTDFTLGTTTGTETVEHYFHPKFSRIFQVAAAIFNSYYGSTDTTRMYADPGTRVTLGGSIEGFGCFVTVSGYTVPN
jgi:hypothetical protein